MSLLDIKQHMKQVKIATLASLCHFFNKDQELVRIMMKHWVKKGCIRQCMKTPACASRCFKCEVKDIEIYEWVETI